MNIIINIHIMHQKSGKLLSIIQYKNMLDFPSREQDRALLKRRPFPNRRVERQRRQVISSNGRVVRRMMVIRTLGERMREEEEGEEKNNKDE